MFPRYRLFKTGERVVAFEVLPPASSSLALLMTLHAPPPHHAAHNPSADPLRGAHDRAGGEDGAHPIRGGRSRRGGPRGRGPPGQVQGEGERCGKDV